MGSLLTNVHYRELLARALFGEPRSSLLMRICKTLNVSNNYEGDCSLYRETKTAIYSWKSCSVGPLSGSKKPAGEIMGRWPLERSVGAHRPGLGGPPPEVQGARRHAKLNIEIPKILQIDGTSFWLPSFSSKMMDYYDGLLWAASFLLPSFPTKMMPH